MLYIIVFNQKNLMIMAGLLKESSQAIIQDLLESGLKLMQTTLGLIRIPISTVSTLPINGTAVIRAENIENGMEIKSASFIGKIMVMILCSEDELKQEIAKIIRMSASSYHPLPGQVFRHHHHHSDTPKSLFLNQQE